MNTHPKNGPESGGKSTRLELTENWGGPEDAEAFRKKLSEALKRFDKVEVLFKCTCRIQRFDAGKGCLVG